MRKNYCDICGKEIYQDKPTKEFLEDRNRYMAAHRRGRFDIQYNQAIVNDAGEVVHFSGDYEFALCSECHERIEKAVWNEIEKMIEENEGKTVTNEIILPKFPKEPLIDTPVCYSNPF